MKVLELVEDYPSPEKSIDTYCHVRSLEYFEQGIDVTVIKFSLKEPYILDGIHVLPPSSYKPSENEYDCLLCLASNIRHHYIFLRKYARYFKHIIFLFLGHETLNLSEVYSKPYPYDIDSIQRIIRKIYDPIKLAIWHRYLPEIAYKAFFVFPTKSYRKLSFRYLRLTSKDLLCHDIVIPNGVDEIFFRESYNSKVKKEYDFITIRSTMDGSVYAIDYLNSLAKHNPDMKFLLIGQGHYFEHYEKAPNITFIPKILWHAEIPQYLNMARCALMPTRHDSQGVMSCEMATFGIPLITSDIPVCREIFRSFPNVALIQNDQDIHLRSMMERLEAGLPYAKNDLFARKNAAGREAELIRRTQKNS